MALSYSSFNTPAGNLAPTFNGGNFTATFNNTATFTCGQGETCAAGEYRQYVKGALSAGGSSVPLTLCAALGTTLSNVYQEDGCPSGTCTAYGHRSCPTGPLDNYTPSQATGGAFSMSDTPGFYHVTAGTAYTVAYEFQGDLINTTNSAVLATRTWTVNGSGAAPALNKAMVAAASTATGAPVGLRTGDKLVSADLTRNLVTGAREVQLVITRTAFEAPLSPNAVSLILKGEDGGVIATRGAPVVHEVGHKGGTTAVIVHTLADAAPTPSHAEISVLDTKPSRGLSSPHVTVLPVTPR